MFIRNLRTDEVLKNGQVIAKDPNANYSAMQHVFDGALPSQFISAVSVSSKNESGKASEYDGCIKAEQQALYNIFEKADYIRLCKMSPDAVQPIIDLTTWHKAHEAGVKGRAAGWASHSFEVLFLRHYKGEILCDETKWDSPIPTQEETNAMVRYLADAYNPHGSTGSLNYWQKSNDSAACMQFLYNILLTEDKTLLTAAVKILRLNPKFARKQA